MNTFLKIIGYFGGLTAVGTFVASLVHVPYLYSQNIDYFPGPHITPFGVLIAIAFVVITTFIAMFGVLIADLRKEQSGLFWLILIGIIVGFLASSITAFAAVRAHNIPGASAWLSWSWPRWSLVCWRP